MHFSIIGFLLYLLCPDHLYIILLVCVLYVTLSMRISVHNKSPELFTVKLESPSRQRVKHSALEQKFPDRYARRRFNSPCLHGISFPFCTFSFFLPHFFPLSPLYPLPLPTPEDFFPHLKPKSVDFPRVSA